MRMMGITTPLALLMMVSSTSLTERDVNPIDVEDQMKSHTLYVATFEMIPKSKESLLASLLAEKKKEDDKLAKEQNLEEEKLATKKNEQQREEEKLSEEKMKPELKLATEKLLEEKVAAMMMEEEKLHAMKMSRGVEAEADGGEGRC